MPLIWGHIESRLLLPAFVEDLKEVFDQIDSTWYVLEGFRSIERSNELYDQYVNHNGPKAAPGGKSAHNFGLAVDLVLDGDPDKEGLQPDWIERHPEWIRMRAAIDAHPRLHGGWWFGDGDHIERTKWQDYKQWRS
jgi:D-alanyl-D-alanine carboxypeptidase.